MLSPASIPWLLLVAVPVIVVMGIWTAITMWTLVFPKGEAESTDRVPVGLAEIMERERRIPSRPTLPHRQRVEAEGEMPSRSPLEEELWLRRN